MNERWTTCSTGCRAAGLTLIEVVAAIAILGAILTGIVVAQSRHLRQIAATQRTDRAIAAADALLERWWADPRTLPVGASGRLEDAALRWVTREVASEPIEAIGARVVRVAFHPAGAQAPGDESSEPMFVVDLVMPGVEPADDPDDDPEAGEGAGRGDGSDATPGGEPRRAHRSAGASAGGGS